MALAKRGAAPANMPRASEVPANCRNVLRCMGELRTAPDWAGASFAGNGMAAMTWEVMAARRLVDLDRAVRAGAWPKPTSVALFGIVFTFGTLGAVASTGINVVQASAPSSSR